MSTKNHKMHYTHQVKKMRRERARREAFKAWMAPTRLFKDSWRAVQWIAMICIAPFVLIYFIYLLLRGKIHPVWDGG